MPQLIRRRWEAQSDPGTGLSRRDRRSCTYEAYVPDMLSEKPLAFDAGVAADIADAEREIVRLNEQTRALIDTEALACLLLRAESVASSRIEGLEIGARRLLHADAAQHHDGSPKDVGAADVLANINAMAFACRAIGKGDMITLDHLLEAHRRLLVVTHLSTHAGHLRNQQNWIGGSSFNPCSAAFVPAPPEMLAALLEDLCRFCNTDALPTLAQAAIAHAQFETIHPFVDGNGRVGRMLIHMILRRRGLATRVLIPISLVLATQAKDYMPMQLTPVTTISCG